MESHEKKPFSLTDYTVHRRHCEPRVIRTLQWPLAFRWPWGTDSYGLFIVKHKPPWNWRKPKVQITQTERVNSLHALRQKAGRDLWTREMTCSDTIECLIPSAFPHKKKMHTRSLFCAELVFGQWIAKSLISEAGKTKWTKAVVLKTHTLEDMQYYGTFHAPKIISTRRLLVCIMTRHVTFIRAFINLISALKGGLLLS